MSENLTQCFECGEVIETSDATHLDNGRDYCPACAPYAIAASILGRKGGSVKSERKAKTSAENGRRGGRPKAIRKP